MAIELLSIAGGELTFGSAGDARIPLSISMIAEITLGCESLEKKAEKIAAISGSLCDWPAMAGKAPVEQSEGDSG